MIKIKDISKKYGKITALDKLSLEIAKGEMFGLVGPNGAGKTTLISIISTYLNYDSGSVEINKHKLPMEKTKIKKIIGIVPQEIALYDDLSAKRNLLFWGSFYNLDKNKLKEQADILLKKVGLYDRRNEKIATFSGGMKRRLNIAAGILHNPEIILFDEPTVGVDAQSRNFIFEVIKNLHKEGKTIIYTSHYMEEVEKLCTRIGIIDKGKLIAIGTKEKLYKKIEEKSSATVKLKNNNKALEVFNQFNFQQLDNNEFVIFGKNITEQFIQLLEALKNKNVEIMEFNLEKPNLERLFLHLTGKELRE